MQRHRGDALRLGALLVVAALALIGRGAIRTDVENLSMKSTGTDAAAVAGVRSREFGIDPTLVAVAVPRAPQHLAELDAREIEAWIRALRARPEVTRLEAGPAPAPGGRALSISVAVGADGGYADAVESLSAAARASLPPTFRLSLSGQPAAEIAIARALDVERRRVLPLLLGALGLVLLGLYRSPVLALGALLAPLASVLLIEGAMGWLGVDLNPVSVLLGPALLTVGVASSVHVLEHYLAARRGGATREAASRTSARELWLPFVLTAVTTVTGFLALTMNPIPAVLSFGLLASAGVVLAHVIALLALPSFLRLFDHSTYEPRGMRSRTAVRFACSLRRAAGPVLAVSAVGSLLLLSLWRTLPVDSDPLQVLPPGHALRRQVAELSQDLGGSDVFELLLPPPQPEPFLPAMASLIASVGRIDGVVRPAGRPRRSAAGYVLVPFLVAARGSREQEATFAGAERAARAAGWPDASATGLTVRIARDSNALSRSLRDGVLVTLAGLWLVMALGLRSPWLALLGLLPNVVPLLVVYGGLALFDRPLSVASSMIGTVMLGLVVDDTIHFLHAFRMTRSRALGGTPTYRTLARALRRVGRPLVVTTLVLSAGFAATVFGELETTREFGVLATVTLLTALAADLVLLPAALLVLTRRLLPRPAVPPCPRPITTS